MRLHGYTPPSIMPIVVRVPDVARVANGDDRLLKRFAEQFSTAITAAVVPTPEELTAATDRVYAQLEGLAPDLAAAYEAAMRSAGRSIGSRFKTQAVALVADGQFIPPNEDEVLGQQLRDEMQALSSDAQRDAAAEVVKAFGAEGISFDVEQAFTEPLLAAIGEQSSFAADAELRGVYRDLIRQAAEEGWSIPRTAEEIVVKVDDIAAYRAVALARTDLVGLANGGSVHVATITTAATAGDENVVYKRWLATDDELTRESHVEADGQTVPVDDNFTVGGASLRYPGDPFAPAEELWNCRCTVIFTSTPGEAVVRADAYAAVNENEEVTMRTTVIEQLADTNADGEVQMLTPIAWDAVLCVEGEATEDGRLLERGSIAWRDLPLTLMGMLETSDWGHEGAKVAGRIDAISRVVDELVSSGELTSEFGVNDLAPLISDRTVRGVSVDLAVLDYEYRDRETGEVLSEDDLFEYWLEGKESQILFTVLDGTIVGATVCPMPAIANAEIVLAASAGLDEHARTILASALEGRRQLLGDVPIIRVFTPFEQPAREGLFATAAVELADPSRSAFELTEFPGNTPFTVTDPDETGWRRVFGHLATWDTCHVGIPGVCTTAPRSSTDPAYALFHQHQYPIAEGGYIDVGVMMLGTGHASLGASRMEATKHYDKPDMIGAYVRAYDGEHGIWVSGVARDTLTSSGLRELRTNPPSGDWRQYNGRLELIAACAVAVPGFPVVASAEANITAAGGHIAIDALIASAGEIVPSAEVKAAMIAAGCACEDLATDDEYVDDLAELGVE